MLKHLTTEARNPASEAIDTLTPLEIVRLMNAEDALVAPAVAAVAEQVASAIEIIAERFRRGGRLIYIGAGTSGRLGVLDATECPPTFNSPPAQVIGLIAGGPTALTRAVEGAEDRPGFAIKDLQDIGLSKDDVVVGIATSGRTPYVIGGLQFARQCQAATIAFSCNASSALAAEADVAITPIVGPEVISGSTRLKAGTATKLVLNMLTTGAMVRIGKTYGNLMVDLRATNTKLRDRTQRIVAHLTSQTEERAQALLDECQGELKTAVVLHHLDAGIPDRVAVARRLLTEAGGQLRRAIELGRPPAAARIAEDLVLGIDGGGTGTVAHLARLHADGSTTLLGRGLGGAANPQAVGFARAFRVLDEAIAAAFAESRLPHTEVGSACLALAGAGRDGDRLQLEAWAASRKLARHFQQVHDALPVLADGTPHGVGIALIAGTGSLAFGRNAEGRTARAGGWGYLFGDEGSAYWIAVAALRAVAVAADGRGPRTLLSERLCSQLQIERADQLVPAVHGRSLDRAAVAGLAPAVMMAAAQGDEVAVRIVAEAVEQLAAIVVAVARQLDLRSPTPLALAGGVLDGNASMQQRLKERLLRAGIAVDPVNFVSEPAKGALRLAAESLLQAPGG